MPVFFSKKTFVKIYKQVRIYDCLEKRTVQGLGLLWNSQEIGVYFDAYFKEFKVAGAAVEHLFDKDFLVGVGKLCKNWVRRKKVWLRLTWAMNSSAWESIVVTTGLKPLMHTIACSISSENFILFKYNNFE